MSRGERRRTASTGPASPRSAGRAVRALRFLVVLAVLAAACVGAYARYESTTCQLRRAFATAGWTCLTALTPHHPITFEG
jgi:hypothetical protein